jgi:hypothetical protein
LSAGSVERESNARPRGHVGEQPSVETMQIQRFHVGGRDPRNRDVSGPGLSKKNRTRHGGGQGGRTALRYQGCGTVDLRGLRVAVPPTTSRHLGDEQGAARWWEKDVPARNAARSARPGGSVAPWSAPLGVVHSRSKRRRDIPGSHGERFRRPSGNCGRLQGIAAVRRRAWFSSARPVTPEVAGSSSVAPAPRSAQSRGTALRLPLLYAAAHADQRRTRRR